MKAIRHARGQAFRTTPGASSAPASIAPCIFFHPLLFYCCRHHVFCLRGRPVFYKGFGISPCVFELHEPDPVSWRK